MVKKMDRKEVRKMIVDLAKSFVGVPYKYGATMDEAPRVFDCSGFVKFLYGRFGYEIPRSTILQATYIGNVVKNKKDLLPGDLMYLTSKSGHYNKKYPQGIGHVVMYLGDGKCIHATAKRLKDYPVVVEKGEVRIDDLGLVIKNSGPLVVIKRII